MADEAGNIPQRGSISSGDILIRTEKLEAKIDTLNSSISSTQDRISRLSEEIGELRAMIIEREKKFTDIETGFEKMREAVSVIKPESIDKNLKGFEKNITKMTAQVEKNSLFLTKISEDMKSFRTKLKSIQSLENIADVMKQVQEKADDADNSSRTSSRMAAKAEKMFLELDKRLPELEKSMDRINEMDEMTKNLMRVTDELSIKLKTSVHKEDLEKLDLDIRDRIENLATQMKTGMAPAKSDEEIDIPKVDKIITKSQEIEEDEVPIGEFDIPEPDSIPASTKKKAEEKPKLGKTIPEMVTEARGYLKLGGKSSAKELYDKILVEYKEMEIKQPIKAKEYYAEINKLYKDLVSENKN